MSSNELPQIIIRTKCEIGSRHSKAAATSENQLRGIILNGMKHTQLSQIAFTNLTCSLTGVTASTNALFQRYHILK